MAIEWIAASWEEIEPSTIFKCWKNLWPLKMQDASTQTDNTSEDIMCLSESIGSEKVDTIEHSNNCDVQNLLSLLKKVSGFESVNKQTIENWLQQTHEETGKLT